MKMNFKDWIVHHITEISQIFLAQDYKSEP